jgi:uncharacterized membrane protein YeaQ/YmgE (transglycosylase-associated protein family)
MIWNILIGFLIGLAARFLMPGRDAMGFILTTVLGIGGAWLGTFLGQQVGWYFPGEPASFLGSVFGAIVILMIFRTLKKTQA